MGELGRQLEVLSVAPEFSASVLEFASTGSAIYMSAGPDEAESAPDLWRVTPGPSTEPELVWRNDRRDRSLARIAGDLDSVVFVDMPTSGELGWNLWLIPEEGADAILLDSHPGDPTVPGLAPSFAVYQPSIVWAAFDRGADGPVSQLLYATAPDWEPHLLGELPADEAEYWFPSLYGDTLVYSVVRYTNGGQSDERMAYLMDLSHPEAPPRRIDTSGRATMPLVNQFAIIWKEADPGFNMMNWGTMYRYDLASDSVAPLGIRPQEYVNFPSIGERFAAWWGVDGTSFAVYDLERRAPRSIIFYGRAPERRIVRPHIGGSLLAWLYTETINDRTTSEIRYAYLPGAGTDRLNPP